MKFPSPIESVAASDWDSLPTSERALAIRHAVEQPGFAARALRYAHRDAHTYDQVANRLAAVLPYRGAVPLLTLGGEGAAAERDSRRWSDPSLASARRQHELLAPRLIDLPDGRSAYRVERDYFKVTRLTDDGKRLDGPWLFPISAPPDGLSGLAEDDDEALLFAQRYTTRIPGAFWLRATDLIKLGAFERMQDIREHLTSELRPATFYCFVSHRWLTAEHPDPEGLQARVLAWQLVAHVCEAVVVASRRGLHTPRRFARSLGCAFGVTGSTLAESLLVNVLRPSLDDGSLARAHAEAQSLAPLLVSCGIPVAHGDEGLRRLSAELAMRPLLAGLLGKIMLWVDYCCVPQAPRTTDDDELFKRGLQYLHAIQLVSRTVIILDDCDDYLGRAWCSVEALQADAAGGAYSVLAGVRTTADDTGAAKLALQHLIADRPHLVWRALLDTELFKVQTPEQCLARLGLRTTDARDVPFLYQQLVRLGAPDKVHVDDGELNTGVLPVPLVGGRAFLPRTGAREMVRSHVRVSSIDGSSARKLRGENLDVPALVTGLRRQAGRRAASCHVAVIAHCEGEAILISDWCLSRRSELESIVEAELASLSWIACDIAPVGRFVCGQLSVVGIEDADVWLLVTTSGQLGHGVVASALSRAVRAAGKAHTELCVDLGSDNARTYAPAPPTPENSKGDTVEEIAQARLANAVHAGGLFRAVLFSALA